MPDTTAMTPLLFDPIYKEKVWGERKLEQLGRTLPGDSDTKIGESWELADLGQTSVSGGGGGAARSAVSAGPFAGRTLHELITEFGQAVTGDLPLTPEGNFPLLVKFLDAGSNLSAQVHPNAAYAAAHPDAFLKSECWYVLAADDGAVIYKGVKEGTTADQFRAAIADGTVQDLLITVPVKPGDMHYVPSGTCHALGAGVLAAEVQTPSDTTFRVYDWGRVGRELHIEQAMECIHLGPPDVARYEKRVTVKGEHATRTSLVECEYFKVDRIVVEPGYTASIASSQPVVWMVLEGGGAFTRDGDDDLAFGRAQTMLLPPALHDHAVRFDAAGTYLEVTFPQAETARLA